MEETREFIDEAGRIGIVKYGLIQVIKIRTNCFYTAKKLADMGFIEEIFKKECPCCRKEEEEDIIHIIKDCEYWKEQRKNSFGGALGVNSIKLLACHKLLGGKLQRWMGETPTVGNVTEEVIFSTLLNIISFLNRIMQKRKKILFP